MYEERIRDGGGWGWKLMCFVFFCMGENKERWDHF